MMSGKVVAMYGVPCLDGFGSDSDSHSDSDSDSVMDGDYDGIIRIFPGSDEEEEYPPADLREFSKKAINKYNQENEGCKYEFVELVEAFLEISFKSDCISTIFKACQRDDPTIVTSFRAVTYCASRTLCASDLDIEVVPFHSQSGSDISSASESEFQASPHYQAEKLRTLVEPLQI